MGGTENAGAPTTSFPCTRARHFMNPRLLPPRTAALAAAATLTVLPQHLPLGAAALPDPLDAALRGLAMLLSASASNDSAALAALLLLTGTAALARQRLRNPATAEGLAVALLRLVQAAEPVQQWWHAPHVPAAVGQLRYTLRRAAAGPLGPPQRHYTRCLSASRWVAAAWVGGSLLALFALAVVRLPADLVWLLMPGCGLVALMALVGVLGLGDVGDTAERADRAAATLEAAAAEVAVAADESPVPLLRATAVVLSPLLCDAPAPAPAPTPSHPRGRHRGRGRGRGRGRLRGTRHRTGKR